MLVGQNVFVWTLSHLLQQQQHYSIPTIVHAIVTKVITSATTGSFLAAVFTTVICYPAIHAEVSIAISEELFSLLGLIC